MPKLIIGCGYLGRRIARRWRGEGHQVFGVVRRADQYEQLAAEGIRPILADVTRPETLRAVPPAETVLYSVGYDSASGKSRWDIYVEGLRNVLDALSPATPRVIFTSSASVYGDAGGQWVDEDSPCRPESEAARALAAAENLLAAHALGQVAVVLRLAGLYGPGRLPQTADLRSGRPLAVVAGSLVNLIHVEDAARAVLAGEVRAMPPRTYVVSDGHPVERREYLRRLAEVLQFPPPTFCVEETVAGRPSRSLGQKRLRNTRLLDELGLEIEYPSYYEGLAAAVAACEASW
ncbi:MAG: SDR family oxidoreductase [Thermoguttaceae bacterium]|jgi:nucleoside-diphosphate-sugar epimerase